jgi:hypothetical protein
MGSNEATALDESAGGPAAHESEEEEEVGEVLSGYGDEAEEGDRDIPRV